MLLYFFTFLAGIATVLSPCVLPVLPAILSGSVDKGRYRPLGIVLGLIISFAFFTLSLSFLVQQLGLSANLLRYIAIGIIGLFGIVMLFPRLSNRFQELSSSLGNAGLQLQSHSTGKKKGFCSGLFLGAALGLVWTPCAGPILAVVTTLVATQSLTWQIILLTLTYSLGAGIPLLLIAYGGNKALQTLPYLSRHSETIKKGFGALMILTAVALYYNFEVYLQQIAIKYIPTLQIENSPQVQNELNKLRPQSRFDQKVDYTASTLPDLGPAPEFAGISNWINSSPLTLQELKGKVVLVDFWTYSCINCIRTLPYIRSWYEKYKDQGFVVVGVHTPEFEFEKDLNNVKRAVERFNIAYPVALDNDYKTWQAYSNSYWPAHYLIDQNGHVRQFHAGEGRYLETENAIRELLGLPAIKETTEAVKKSRTLTPETYLGTARGDTYSKAMKIQEGSFTYNIPLLENELGLKGKWLAHADNIVSESQTSELNLNFIASQVYLVMESKEPQTVTVLLDGASINKTYYTPDMNQRGQILVHEARKYDILNLQGDYGRHVLTLIMPEGVTAYAFTFGDNDKM